MREPKRRILSSSFSFCSSSRDIGDIITGVIFNSGFHISIQISIFPYFHTIGKGQNKNMDFIGMDLCFSIHLLPENIHIYFLSFTNCMEIWIWKYGNYEVTPNNLYDFMVFDNSSFIAVACSGGRSENIFRICVFRSSFSASIISSRVRWSRFIRESLS